MPDTNAAPVRPVKALQCYLAYISAFIAGAVIWWFLQNLLNSLIWVGFISTCAATIVVWIYSVSNNNSSIYDPYWVIAPLIFSTAFLFVSRRFDPRSVVIVSLFWIWSFRYHIFYAWTGWRTGLIHEDWRYENMRSAPVPYWLNSLLGMHLFPTILVYLAFIPPAYVLLETTPARQALGVWDFIAGIGALTAVVIEYVANRQLNLKKTAMSTGPAPIT